MKLNSYRSLYKAPHLRNYFIFIIAFYVLMNLSKTLQTLYFDAHHQLGNFGLAYSAMALAGAFSFLHAPWVTRISRGNPLLGPLLFYSLGMGLRIFTDSSVLTIAAGLLAGIGASSALYALRAFLANERGSEHFDVLLSHKNVLQQGATAAGVALIGATLALFSFLEDPYKGGLLFCAGAMFLLCTLWRRPTQIEVAKETKESTFVELFRKHRFVTCVLVSFSVATGLAISCCAPFMILALKNQGIQVSWIGVILSSGVLLSAILQTLLTPHLKHKHRLRNFVITETALAIFTYALTLLSLPVLVVVVIYLARLLVLSLSIFLQESLEYSLLPKENSSELLGLMQSAFLVGDMLGGSVSGFIAQSYGVMAVLKISALLFLINGLAFVICIKVSKQLRPDCE